MWPLTAEAARLLFLTSVCAVAEGATGVSADAAHVVAAVLLDPQCRLTLMNGKPGKARSVASILCATVTWFLGGVLDDAPSARWAVAHGLSRLAVSADGRALMTLPSAWSCVDSFQVVDGASGRFLRTVKVHSERQIAFGGRDDIFELERDYAVRVWGFVATSGRTHFRGIFGHGRVNHADAFAVHGDTVAVNCRDAAQGHITNVYLAGANGGVRFIDRATDVATEYFGIGTFYHNLAFTCDGSLLAAWAGGCVHIIAARTGALQHVVALGFERNFNQDRAIVFSAFHELLFAYREALTHRHVLRAVLVDGTQARVPPRVRSAGAGIALCASKLYVAGIASDARDARDARDTYWPEHVAVYDV